MTQANRLKVLAKVRKYVTTGKWIDGQTDQKYRKLVRVYGKSAEQQEKLVDDILNFKNSWISASRLCIALSDPRAQKY